MFIVKAGLPSILFLCTSYMKEIVKQLKTQKNKYIIIQKEDIIDLNTENDEKKTLSDISFILNKKDNKTNKNNNYLSEFFQMHISLLFCIPSFSFFLQIVSLYFLSFVGTTSDVLKNKFYLIFTLAQTISTVSSLLPLFF